MTDRCEQVEGLHARAHAHTRTRTHTHTHTHARMHAGTYARTHAHTHAHTHTRTHTRTHTHTHTHTYTHTHIHMHIHTHKHTHMYKRAQSTHKLPVHSAKGFANFSASLAMLPPTCRLYNQELEKRDFYTYLGMLFDQHMNLHHAASHALRSLMRLSIKVFECGCQVWATSSLTYDSSKITPTHVLHLGFLKRLLGVKRGTNTHCVLRKTGQLPIFFFWFRCIIRFWNSLHSSNNPFLEKVVRSDLLIAK